jgi:hypothetical protein
VFQEQLSIYEEEVPAREPPSTGYGSTDRWHDRRSFLWRARRSGRDAAKARAVFAFDVNRARGALTTDAAAAVRLIRDEVIFACASTNSGLSISGCKTLRIPVQVISASPMRKVFGGPACHWHMTKQVNTMPPVTRVVAPRGWKKSPPVVAVRFIYPIVVTRAATAARTRRGIRRAIPRDTRPDTPPASRGSPWSDARLSPRLVWAWPMLSAYSRKSSAARRGVCHRGVARRNVQRTSFTRVQLRTDSLDANLSPSHSFGKHAFELCVSWRSKRKSR